MDATYIRAFGILALIALQSVGCTKPSPVSAASHKKQGDSFLSQSQFSAAVSAYTAALQLDSNYSQAHYGLADAYMQLGDFDKAARSSATAAIVFGTSHRLRDFLGEEHIDFEPPAGVTILDMVDLALAIEEKGQKIWIDPYRRLAVILTQYDRNGKPLDDGVRRRILLGLSDREGLFPPELLQGIDPDTAERVRKGMQLLNIVQVHEVLPQSVPSYEHSIRFNLAFENDEWCAAADQFVKLAEFWRTQEGKERGQVLLERLRNKCKG